MRSVKEVKARLRGIDRMECYCQNCIGRVSELMWVLGEDKHEPCLKEKVKRSVKM